MSEPTIGPWFYDRRTGSIGSPAGWIARIDEETQEQKSDVPHGDVDANGYLIAASWEMFEELKRVRDGYLTLVEMRILSGDYADAAMKYAGNIGAIIRKAKGES